MIRKSVRITVEVLEDRCVPSATLRSPDSLGNPRDISVMSRNLYVGADFSPIFDPTAPGGPVFQASLAWNDIKQTNFPLRAEALADEIAENLPDLIGLQEVIAFYSGPADGGPFAGAPATHVEFDYLQILLDELDERGLHYGVIAELQVFEEELTIFPDLTRPLIPANLKDIRLTDREVILARTDLPTSQLTLSNVQTGHYLAHVAVPLTIAPFGTTIISFDRGWASVDVTVPGKTFRFISTHLEPEGPTSPVQPVQAMELLAGPASTALPVLVVGDFNSRPDGSGTSTYAMLIAAGFTDAWSAVHPGQLGYTFGHKELLNDRLDTPSNFDRRIDLVLYRGDFRALHADVLGEETADFDAYGIWPSDHAGVVATLHPAARARDAVPLRGTSHAITTSIEVTPAGVLISGVGSGNANYLGTFTFTGSILVNPLTGTFVSESILTTANGDQIYLHAIGGFDRPDPETGLFSTGAGTFTIMGGTGDFANATGGGTFEKFIGADFTLNETFQGTISTVHSSPPTSDHGAERDMVIGDPKDWPMYNHDPEGTRSNPAESRLRPENVDDLEVKWTFPTRGSIAGTPAVVKNIIYTADTAGTVYALNHDGTLRWSTTVRVPTFLGAKVVSSLLVTNRTIIFGDIAGYIHGLDVDTGKERWRVNPNPHPFAAILGAPTMIGEYVAIGTSSLEFLAPAINPAYPGFTFRGSVVLLDPANGRVIWQTFLVPEPTLQPDGSFGPSGATVWSSPAYDRESNTIYVGTSNNYSLPSTETSDALIALDAADGHIRWVSQKTADDHWNYSFLPPDPTDPPDFDFGDSPQIYSIDGRKVVGAGQKNGFYHVVDAATGAEVTTPQQFLPGGFLGGFHIDSAVADGVVYANGNYWPDPFSGAPPLGGALFAIEGDGSGELWHFDTELPILSGVAEANGVVYFQSIDGTFYAVDAKSGTELTRLFTGGQSSGPAISRGQIYLGTGNVLSTVYDPFLVPGPGSIVALGLSASRGKAPHDRPETRGNSFEGLTSRAAHAVPLPALATSAFSGADFLAMALASPVAQPIPSLTINDVSRKEGTGRGRSTTFTSTDQHSDKSDQIVSQPVSGTIADGQGVTRILNDDSDAGLGKLPSDWAVDTALDDLLTNGRKKRGR